MDGIFQMRGIFKPTYIDLGANDPFKLNNTAIFYLRGGRGMNVEANPNLIGAFKKWRPDDINLSIGVGDEIAELDFFIMEDDTFSTFSLNERDRMVACGHKFLRAEKVQVRPLSWILEEYAEGLFPDFLSLDVEGLDLQILNSIDWARSSPKVVCVEAAEYSQTGCGARREELIRYLESQKYFEYANTNLNAIMVRRDFWFGHE